jgi:nitrogen regulatory protein PII
MNVAIEELSKVEIITKEAKVEELISEFGKFGITGMTIYDAMGCGVQLGTQEYESEKNTAPQLLSKQVVMVVLPSKQVDEFLKFVEKALYTGHIGDGKIFVSPVTNAIRVRTGEEGMDALVEGDLD